MSENEPLPQTSIEPLELISQTGLARMLRVSKQRVTQLKQSGNLPTPHGIIDDDIFVWTREAAEQFSVERNKELGKISLQE